MFFVHSKIKRTLSLFIYDSKKYFLVFQVNLDKANDPDNVNWYKVVLGSEDIQLEETELIKINKKRGEFIDLLF